MSHKGAANFDKLEEDFTCSVCIDELVDPVSISCGHTFCRGCITEYWDEPGPQYCPECRKTCRKDQIIPAFRLKNLVASVQAVKEEQAKQNPASALQLVYTDTDGRLQLDESVVQRCFLDTKVSQYPLCLICVIGEKRKGKSTLMNYILRALQCLEKHQAVSLGPKDESLTGFEWRLSNDIVTKGILIWSKPFILERNGEKMAVFVLDTEGSLDIESDQETCLKLSALSMLFSSYLIFNVNSGLKTTDLDYLEMYLHVSELTGKSFSLQHLQHLDVLVRDWQNPDYCGHEAAQKYLRDECQKLQKTSKNGRVLDTFTSPSVSGFLLPHPGNEFLKSSWGRLADMGEEFRDHLTTYISKLVEEIWHHQKTNSCGEKITCADVGRALKEFVIILQRREYSFSSPLQVFHSLQNRNLMKEKIKQFHHFLENQIPTNASPTEVLEVTRAQMRTRVINEADAYLDTYKAALQGNNDAEKEMHMEEIKYQLTEKQERFCAEYSNRYTECAMNENQKNKNVIIRKFQHFLNEQLPADAPLLKIPQLPSTMESKVNAKAKTYFDEYKCSLKGDDAAVKKTLIEEMRSTLTDKQNCFYKNYSIYFAKCSAALAGSAAAVVGGTAVGAAVVAANPAAAATVAGAVASLTMKTRLG